MFVRMRAPQNETPSDLIQVRVVPGIEWIRVGRRVPGMKVRGRKMGQGRKMGGGKKRPENGTRAENGTGRKTGHRPENGTQAGKRDTGRKTGHRPENGTGPIKQLDL